MKIAIGNIKMNIISKVERDNYFSGIRNGLADNKFKDVQIIICPPAIHLETFGSQLSPLGVSLGAQNIYTEERGRFTGEISAPMVKNFAGDYVIIGHSERRTFFNETNELISRKIKIALKNGLKPILCVGESMQTRLDGEIKKVLLEQLVDGLRHATKNKLGEMIIAYEPIWSIGSGKTPTGDEVMEARILIQKILIDNFGLSLNKLPKIIYGGSVDYKNIKEVCLDSGMDGALVGGESLHPVDFIKIVQLLNNN
ncbi:MAG: triose-phosphate isomerase [Candidatus Moraniibacteriota bacterium]